jgi:hypothetical protein
VLTFAVATEWTASGEEITAVNSGSHVKRQTKPRLASASTMLPRLD